MNHYERLGVSADATRDVIRAAYRERARALHPDATGHRDDERMAGINDAWHVLGDPYRRRRYDETIATDRSRADTPVAAFDRDDVATDSAATRTLARLITSGVVLGAAAGAVFLLIALLEGY